MKLLKISSRIMALVMLGALLWISSFVAASRPAESDVCPQVVQKALTVAKELCTEIGRNEACYGHSFLDAQPQMDVTAFDFDAEGDIVDVEELQTLRLSTMDVNTATWGVGLMQLQMGLSSAQPDKNVTLVLFGDVAIENDMSTSPTTPVQVQANGNVRIREFPALDGLYLGAAAPGETLTATGKLADETWVRVLHPETGVSGWIAAWLLADRSPLADVEVVEPRARYYGPMQAFHFNSSSDDALCPEAPDSGIVIQTPEGVGKVTFLLNEIDIQIGSTVYFQVVSDDQMVARVVEGAAVLTARGVTSTAAAGMEISVPLNEEGFPAGVPSPPRAYNMEDVRSLPLSLLPREIVIAPPASPQAVEETQAANEQTVPADGETAPTGGAEGEAGPGTVESNGVPGGTAPAGEASTGPAGEGEAPLANGDSPPPPPEEEEKVTLCHKEKNTITVGASAVQAHLDHGDTLGACP